MLQENILGNNLLLYNIAGADILADAAVFANFGIDAGMHLFLVNRNVGAVCLAVAAHNAAGGAILCLLCRGILGRAGNHLYALVRHDGDKMLGAGVCTIAAADALIGIYLGNALDDGNSIIAANGNTFTVAKAAGGAHTIVAKLKLCCLLAGLDAHVIKDNGASAITAAAHKCDTALKLGEVMQLVHNNLFAALDGAGNAANTLFIIDNGVIIDNGNCSLRAGSLTFAAGNAAIAADFSYKLIVLFGRRARNKVCSVGRNHADKSLRTYALFGAVAAAITLFLINNYLAVNKLHGTLGAACDAGTDAYAAVLAFAPHKAHLNGLSAGLALCEASLSGSASGAGNKGDLFLLLLSTIRSH